MIKEAIHKSFRKLGLDIIHFPPREKEWPPDFRKDEAEIIQAVRPWTSTSPERIYALIQAVRYVSANNIAGPIVECGVWKGGSMAAVARTLLQRQDVRRDLYLFDTFEGMSEPSAHDVDYTGKRADEVMRKDSGYKCADAPLERVKEVLYWYASTKHELVHLFPRLSKAGVLIIDDYGHWKGSRQACDEYFAEHRVPILLNRIDYTGRMALKP